MTQSRAESCRIILPALPAAYSLDQGIEEPGLFAVIDQGRSERDGDMGFACIGSAHQNEIMGFLDELACRTVRSGPRSPRQRYNRESGKVFMMGELRGSHLVLDRAHPALYSLRIDQLLYRCGQIWWLARAQQIMGASCHSMQPQGGQLVDQGIHAATCPTEHSVL